LKKVLQAIFVLVIFIGFVSCDGSVNGRIFRKDNSNIEVEKNVEVFFEGDDIRDFVTVYYKNPDGTKTEITDYNTNLTDDILESTTSSVEIEYQNEKATISLSVKNKTVKEDYILKSQDSWIDGFEESGFSRTTITKIVFTNKQPEESVTKVAVTESGSTDSVFGYYNSTENIFYIVGERIIGNQDSSYMFCNNDIMGLMSEPTIAFTSLVEIDFGCFETKNIENMEAMFWFCSELSSLDLSSFNTSNVTKMSAMFALCRKLSSLDLSSFDTSNVTSMFSIIFDFIPSGMFNGCSNLTSLDISSFNTKKVTDFSNLFNECEKLTNLDLTNFDVSLDGNRDTLEASSMVSGWVNGHTFKVSATMIGDATSWGSDDGTWGWYKLLHFDAANWITSIDPDDPNVIIFTHQSYL